MEAAIPAVFAVITFEPLGQVFQSHGTAFFIDDEGVFVTAAHTFKHPFRHNYAIVNGEAFEITPLLFEYANLEGQEPPVYHDLFIGRVDGLPKKSGFYSLNDDLELTAGMEMVLEGFKQTEKEPLVPTKVRPEFKTIEDLQDIDDDEEIETLSENEDKLKRLLFEAIPLTYKSQGFKHIDEKMIERAVYNNGFSIEMEVNAPHGHSGGPILIDGTVAGMLIGQEAAISAVYIQEQLRSIDHQRIMLPSVAVERSFENNWLYEVLGVLHGKLSNDQSIYQAQWPNLCFVAASDLGQLRNEVYASLTNGFSGAQSNYRLGDADRLVHIIVINEALCRTAGLTQPELIAVIAHELGHIFNEYTPQRVPNQMDSFLSGEPFDEAAVNKIKYENEFNKECYADDYARRQGYLQPLISGLKKYLNDPYAKNREMINERIARLENEPADLIGNVKLLRAIQST